MSPDDHTEGTPPDIAAIDCAHVLRVLQSYLDGEVDAAMASRVAHHLDGCPDCSSEAAAFRGVISAIRARAAAVSDADVAGLRDVIDRLTT